MTARRAGGEGGLSSRIVFLAVEDGPRHQCAGTGHVRIDPQGLAEMIREGLLMVDLDLSVRFARRSLATHAQSPQRIPLADQEGQQ